MRAEALEQPAPIQILATGVQQMRDIGAIISFVPHDRRFRPDNLLRRADLERHAEQFGLDSRCKPCLVHPGYTIA